MAMFDIIKYEGPNDVFVWKHPGEDFNTHSRLIVHDSQEAVFFKDGQALDLFGGGSHTLSTDNIPILKKLINLPFGKKTPFHCEVYFINKVTSMGIGWGTDSPIDMEDPRYHIFVKVRSNGRMNIRVADSRKLLIKLVGTISEFNTATLSNYFKGVMMTKIKNRIAGTMINRGVSFLEVSAHLSELSESIKLELAEEFMEYGLELAGFNINTISVPDEDYARLKTIKEEAAITQTQTDAEVYKTVRLGEAMAQARKAQGYSYQDERAFDVMKGAAENSGGSSGGMMGMGMGLGMGFGMGGPMGQAMGNMVSNYMPGGQGQAVAGQTPAAGESKCSACGAANKAGAKFCCDCGSPMKTERFCGACGAKQPVNAKFCSECGEKF